MVLIATTPYDEEQWQNLHDVVPRAWWQGTGLNGLAPLLGVQGITSIGQTNLLKLADEVGPHSRITPQQLRETAAECQVDQPLIPYFRTQEDLPVNSPVMVWVQNLCFEEPGSKVQDWYAGDWYPGVVYCNQHPEYGVRVQIFRKMTRTSWIQFGNPITNNKPSLAGYGLELHMKSPRLALTRDFTDLASAGIWSNFAELWVRTSGEKEFHNALVASLTRQ